MIFLVGKNSNHICFGHLTCSSQIEIAGVKFGFFLPDQAPLKNAMENARMENNVASSDKSETISLSRTDENKTFTNSPGSDEMARMAKRKHEIKQGENLIRKRARIIYTPFHEPGVDYKSSAVNSARKPPFSYASLIAEAILSSPMKKMTLNKIYSFIQENYAFYRHTHNGWQVNKLILNVNLTFQLRIPFGIISR